MSYNEDLQSNNAELQAILNAVNSLPNASGGSGGGAETWRLLRTITIPEDPATDTSGVEWYVDDAGLINACRFSTDADGNTFNCRKLFVRFAVGNYDNSTSKALNVLVNSTTLPVLGYLSNFSIGGAVKNDYTTGEMYIESLNGANVSIARFASSNATMYGGTSSVHGAATPTSWFTGRNGFDSSSFKSIAFGTDDGFGFKKGGDYGFKVWGVDV